MALVRMRRADDPTRNFSKPKNAKDLIPAATKFFVVLFIIGFVIQLSYFNWDMRWRICDRHHISHGNCTALFTKESASWCKKGSVIDHHNDKRTNSEIGDALLTRHSVKEPIESEETIIIKQTGSEEEEADEEEFEECDEIKEMLEEESVEYLVSALLIYCLPVILVVLPTAALLDKFPQGWIIVAMLCGAFTCLTSILQISFLNKLSPTNLVTIVIPAGIVGNEILLKLLAFGELGREEEIMELFEKCALIQSAFVAGKFIGDVIMSFASFSSYWTLGLGIGCFILGMAKLLYAYFREGKTAPIETVEPKSSKLALKLALVFLILMIYFFAEIGESHEELEYMEEDNSWVLVTFSMYGSLTDGMATVALVCATFFAKLAIEKSVIDEKLAKMLNPATIGLIGVLVDAITKLMLTFTDNTGAKIAASILTVFGELVIVSAMCLLVYYTPTVHKMKAVSVAVIAEAVGKVGAGLVFRLVHDASKSWFFGFAFLYQLILLLIPFLSFGYLHFLYERDEMEIARIEDDDTGDSKPFPNPKRSYSPVFRGFYNTNDYHDN